MKILFRRDTENIFQGRMIWMTGAPGMGKSTTAQILARNHGFVYYEADCFGSLKVDLCIDYAFIEARPSLESLHPTGC